LARRHLARAKTPPPTVRFEALDCRRHDAAHAPGGRGIFADLRFNPRSSFRDQ